MSYVQTHSSGQKGVIPPAKFLCFYDLLLSQTQKDIRGKLRVGRKEPLTFFGQVRLNSVNSIHREVKVRGNFSHQLEVKKKQNTQTKTNKQNKEKQHSLSLVQRRCWC